MHCPLNHGAVLQTYALQRYIESLGINTKVIDYNPNYIVYDQSYLHVGDPRLKKNILFRWIYRTIKFPSKYRRKKNFENFKTRELHLTHRFTTYDEIKKAKLNADFFVCGSDQIWNSFNGSHKDPVYFLQFVENKNKRNSYAASGNLPLDNDEINNVTIPMINELNHISMREDVTITSIQPYVNKKITHVCDPVFLLDSATWRDLYKKGSRFVKQEKYVLVYPMGNGVETVIQKGYELAKQLNLPLYCISASQRKDTRVSKMLNVDPYTFLSLIDNADYFVTNSFHGTSFGLIFQKIFWTCSAVGSNQRITSILNKANLADRQISGETQINTDQDIDWTSVATSLSQFISNSKQYINSIINNEAI